MAAASAKTANSLVPSGSEPFTSSSSIPDGNQRFLLYFIIGIYFGPDIKGEKPPKSILQKMVEGLPSYNSDQLGGAYLKTSALKNVYYSALRKAASLAVESPQLDLFFQGSIPNPGNDPGAFYPQFPYLFNPGFHPLRIRRKNEVVDNLVFINDPDTSYMKLVDIEKFKGLLGLDNLKLYKNVIKYHTFLDSHNVGAQGAEPVAKFPRLSSPYSSQKGKHAASAMNSSEYQDVQFVKPLNRVPCNTLPRVPSQTSSPQPTGADDTDTKTTDDVSPKIHFVPSCPSKVVQNEILGAGVISEFMLSGSAAMGQVGPTVGLMDMGECEDAYMFRISLPGVNRNEQEFSCEVENDGKVLIKGVTTTGEKTVNRLSQVFEMQSSNLCPAGDFSVAFQLPGTVNPREFTGNFGADGVLEGTVMKQKQEN